MSIGIVIRLTRIVSMCPGMNRAKQFSTGSAESALQSGQEDPLMRLMRRFGMSVTRENYLNLAFLGEPSEMDAELEAILPSELREH